MFVVGCFSGCTHHSILFAIALHTANVCSWVWARRRGTASPSQRLLALPHPLAFCLSGGLNGWVFLQESGSWRESDSLKLLSEAYRCLGDACMAEAGHEDRDCSAAAKAYAKAAGGTPVLDSSWPAVTRLRAHCTCVGASLRMRVGLEFRLAFSVRLNKLLSWSWR